MATAVASRRRRGQADDPPPTVHLIDVGDIVAVPAGEIAAGGRLMGNYGSTTIVEYAGPKGAQSLDVIERDNETGVTCRHTMRRRTLVAYYDAGRAAGLVPVEDVLASQLGKQHLGRQISTPDGWRRLFHVYIGEVGVRVVVAGGPHRMTLHLDQVVGVRGDVSDLPCGCLEQTYELMGHYPPCEHAAGWALADEARRQAAERQAGL